MVLLTGGTIAWLAAEGHRVIIVAACDGMWADLAVRQLEELQASAAILGAQEVVHLGYADSGHGPVLFEDPPGRTRLARADLEEAAEKLAALLTGEQADLLLSYDPQGGNGLPDHVRVHQIGARAAELAGTHRVNVRRYAAQKRAALMVHPTPLSSGRRAARLHRALTKSPWLVFQVVCGTEWFAEPRGWTGELVASDLS